MWADSRAATGTTTTTIRKHTGNTDRKLEKHERHRTGNISHKSELGGYEKVVYLRNFILRSGSDFLLIRIPELYFTPDSVQNRKLTVPVPTVPMEPSEITVLMKI